MPTKYPAELKTRAHYLHSIANRVVDENQIIALESLSVEGLKRTRLGKSVSDAGWGKLTRLIAEKASERGRTVVTADRWAPTTQTCSMICTGFRSHQPPNKNHKQSNKHQSTTNHLLRSPITKPLMQPHLIPPSNPASSLHLQLTY